MENRGVSYRMSKAISNDCSMFGNVIYSHEDKFLL